MTCIADLVTPVVQNQFLPLENTLFIFIAAGAFTRGVTRVELERHADPCQQFFYCKGLGDVIHGTCIKP